MAHQSKPDGCFPDDDLERLLESLCLGELGADGWRDLAERVRGDRSAAMRYIEASHFCEALRDETGGPEHRPLTRPPGEDGDDRSPALAPGRPDTAARLEPIDHAATDLDSSGAVSARRHGSSARRSFFPWGIAAGLAFVAGWALSPLQFTGTPAPVASRLSAPPMNSAALFSPAEPLGKVIGLTPAASSDGLLRSLTVGSDIRRGEVFQLTEGAARLEIAGGEVIVDGPSELSVIDPTTVFIRSGRVTVRRTGEITVRTPVAIATGANSVFAVIAEADAAARVAALEGEVFAAVAPREDSPADPKPRRVSPGKTLTFQQQKAASVAVGIEDAVPERLLAKWEATHDRLHDYERLVLSDRPLAYWPLHKVRRHRAVLDLTQNGYDGYAIGNWPIEIAASADVAERGAYFDGESYIEAERKPPIDLHDGFTIESWARVAGGSEYQAVFTSRWVHGSNTDQERCFGYTLYAGSNDHWQFWTGSGEYGSNWDQLHATAEVVHHRWTHVAVTFQPEAVQDESATTVAGVVRMYVDGERVGEARRELSLVDFEWPTRIGAAEFVPQSLTSWLFRGDLRDVALYDQPLGLDRIRLHLERGRDAG